MDRRPNPRSASARRSVVRSRWAAIGAAVAVSLGSGGLITASASIDSGERAVFVAIAPCRVLDTRPAPETVGARATPLEPNETYSIAVVGSVGGCTIPSDASAVVVNVAIVNPTGNSYLTLFPAGGAVPVAASLNFVAGQPPVSNAATVDVGAAGEISIYNLRGMVDVTVDISGYYVDHTHDDRYAAVDHTHDDRYAGIDHTHDDRYAGKDQTIVVDGTLFTFLGDAQGGTSNGCFVNYNPAPDFSPNGYLGVSLPVGATLYSARVVMWDSSGVTGYSGSLYLRTVGANGFSSTLLGASFTGGAENITTVTHAINLAQPVVLTGGQSIALRASFGGGQFGNGICQLELDVTLP